MNNKILVIGIMLLAGAAFADGVPYVGVFMQKAWCSYDTDGSLFVGLASDIMSYNSSYEGQLVSLAGYLSDEWDAMQDCTRSDSVEVAALSPVEIQEIQCVKTHYLALNGYMNQVTALYFRVAFNSGASFQDVISQYQSRQEDWMSCLNPRK